MGAISVEELRALISRVERDLEAAERRSRERYDELWKVVCADPARASAWRNGAGGLQSTVDLVSHDDELWAAWKAWSSASDDAFTVTMRLRSLQRLLARAEAPQRVAS